jgi:phosphatidate cytidylyltransferase
MSNPQAAKWADLAVRSISAIVLIPFVLVDIWLGGIWFEVFVGALGVMVALEYTTIAHAGDTRQFALHVLAALCAAFMLHEVRAVNIVWVIAVLAIISIALSGRALSGWKIGGVFYVALPILALVVLRDDLQWGTYAIIWCAVIVWSADTLAYFAGRIVGGPKLVPVLSPKKTWAGLGGAIAGSALASGIFAGVLNLGFWPLVPLAALFAVVEQGGDILESALKRAHGVKDSGDLIPGHGGVLDRVDGLMAVVLAASLVGYLHNAQSAAEGLLHW